MALGLTQPPIQWVPGALSLGIQRLELESDNSPSSIAKVKECVELYPHYRGLHGTVLGLKNSQGQLHLLSFYLYLLYL
jgi:hypothetical protein